YARAERAHPRAASTDYCWPLRSRVPLRNNPEPAWCAWGQRRPARRRLGSGLHGSNRVRCLLTEGIEVFWECVESLSRTWKMIDVRHTVSALRTDTVIACATSLAALLGIAAADAATVGCSPPLHHEIPREPPKQTETKEEATAPNPENRGEFSAMIAPVV